MPIGTNDDHLALPAQPVNASSGNVAAGAAVATISAIAGKTAYLSGFTVTSSGSTTALAVDVTITGLKTTTATYTHVFPAGVLVTSEPLVVTFPHPIQASAANVAIVVTLPSGGVGNAHAAVNAYGFYLNE